MCYNNFKIGFWHPVGPHGKEEFGDILQRKDCEIKKNGWTLCSFQHRPMLEEWYKQLIIAEANNVFVFCSSSEGKNPA